MCVSGTEERGRERGREKMEQISQFETEWNA